MYPKSINNLPAKYLERVKDVSDERNNGDGWWVYLTKDYADFNFDPFSPTRQIHERSLAHCISRLKRARKVTPENLDEFPHLK